MTPRSQNHHHRGVKKTKYLKKEFSNFLIEYFEKSKANSKLFSMFISVLDELKS